METILNKWNAQGYYILTEAGEYKNKPIKQFSLVKDISNTEREINCILNRAAVKIAEKHLPTAHAIKKTVWLTQPECTLHHGFETSKEPLKITF